MSRFGTHNVPRYSSVVNKTLSHICTDSQHDAIDRQQHLDEKGLVIRRKWMGTECERICQMISIHRIVVSHCVEWHRDRSLCWNSGDGKWRGMDFLDDSRSVQNQWKRWNIHGSVEGKLNGNFHRGDGNFVGFFDDDGSTQDGGNGDCGWASGNIASDGNGSVATATGSVVDAVSDVAVTHVEEYIATTNWSPGS